VGGAVFGEKGKGERKRVLPYLAHYREEKRRREGCAASVCLGKKKKKPLQRKEEREKDSKRAGPETRRKKAPCDLRKKSPKRKRVKRVFSRINKSSPLLRGGEEKHCIYYHSGERGKSTEKSSKIPLLYERKKP